jgi:putative transposase
MYSKGGNAEWLTEVVMTDKLLAYLDGIELAYGADAEHRQGSPFDVRANANLIERFQGTLKHRTKVLRGLKTAETARRFLAGWLINYNYFRPHISLKGKTPAQRAGIVLSANDWLDVVKQPTDTAEIELSTEPRPILRLHHPKPILPKIPSARPPRLRRGEAFAGRGLLSKRYFRGARRVRL